MIEIDEEEYDALPFRESRYQNLVRRYGSMYNLTKFEYRYYPDWKIVNRLLQSNLGQPFDNVFSSLCEKYSSDKWYYLKRLFLREVELIHNYYCCGNYYVDDDGLIRKYPSRKRKKILMAKSWDHKYGYINKSTGKPTNSEYPYINSYWGTIAGAVYEFPINDYRYKRFVEDNRKKRKQHQKKLKKEQSKFWDQRLSDITKEMKIKDQKESRIKLISHGFDPVTSFKNH